MDLGKKCVSFLITKTFQETQVKNRLIQCIWLHNDLSTQDILDCPHSHSVDSSFHVNCFQRKRQWLWKSLHKGYTMSIIRTPKLRMSQMFCLFFHAAASVLEDPVPNGNTANHSCNTLHLSWISHLHFPLQGWLKHFLKKGLCKMILWLICWFPAYSYSHIRGPAT